jgi:hypothetical protein
VSCIKDFAKELFSYNDDDTLDTLYHKLGYASIEFNIHICIYRSDGSLYVIKKNRFIYPLVLSVYEIIDLSSYFTLYHRNYKEISPENLNTSTEFFESSPITELNTLESYANDLLKSLPFSQLNQSEKDQIQFEFFKINQKLNRNWIFEEILSKILS